MILHIANAGHLARLHGCRPPQDQNKIVTKHARCQKRTAPSSKGGARGWANSPHADQRSSDCGITAVGLFRIHFAMSTAMGKMLMLDVDIKGRGYLLHPDSHHSSSSASALHLPLHPQPFIPSVSRLSFRLLRGCPDNGNQQLVPDAWLSGSGFEPHLADRARLEAKV